MNVLIESQITKDALELNKLNRMVVKSVVEWNPAELSKSLQEYVKIKKRIKTTLIDNPVVKVHDRTAQDILRKINQDDFQADRFIRIFESQSEVPAKSRRPLEEEELCIFNSLKTLNFYIRENELKGIFRLFAGTSSINPTGKYGRWFFCQAIGPAGYRCVSREKHSRSRK